MDLLFAANISTAVKPLPGFSGSISSLTDTAYNAELHKAFNTWIISGKATPPTLVQQRIHHRRVFHTTRVIVGAILLVTLTVLGMRIWKTLLAHRTATSEKWTAKELLWLVAGMVTVALAIYALVFVLANLQSAIVPIANTLQFG